MSFEKSNTLQPYSEGLSSVNSYEQVRALVLERMREESQQEDEINLRGMSSEKRQDFEKNGFKKDEVIVEGKKVSLLGVFHQPETLPFHREQIEEEIRKSDGLVMEVSPVAQQGQSFEGLLLDRLKALNPERYNRAESLSVGWDETEVFFHDVEKMAWKWDKPIIHTDPYLNSHRYIEDYADLTEKRKIIHRLNDSARGTIQRTLEAVSKFVEIASLGAASMFPLYKYALERGISRRNFLKTLGLAGLAAGSHAYSPKLAVDFLTREDHKGDAWLTYEAILDYRNVMIAKGIEAYIQSKNEEKGSLTVVYGMSHTAGIKKYLEHTRLRDLTAHPNPRA